MHSRSCINPTPAPRVLQLLITRCMYEHKMLCSLFFDYVYIGRSTNWIPREQRSVLKDTGQGSLHNLSAVGSRGSCIYYYLWNSDFFKPRKILPAYRRNSWPLSLHVTSIWIRLTSLIWNDANAQKIIIFKQMHLPDTIVREDYLNVNAEAFFLEWWNAYIIIFWASHWLVVEK